MSRTVTTHQSCGSGPGAKRLCPACMHWDSRPEDGSGPGLGYCSKKDMMTLVRCECDLFDRITKTKVDERNRAIYGEIEEEEGE